MGRFFGQAWINTIVLTVQSASMKCMSMNPLDWESQRAFLAVLREGSLSAAARAKPGSCSSGKNTPERNIIGVTNSVK